MKNEIAAPHTPPIAEPSGIPAMPSSGKPAWPKVSDHSKKIEIGVTMNEVSIGVVVSPAPFKVLAKIWPEISAKKVRNTIRT